MVSVFNVLCGDVQLLFGSCKHHLLVLLTNLPSNQTCNVRKKTHRNIRQHVAKLSNLPNGGHPLGSILWEIQWDLRSSIAVLFI